MKGIPWPKHKPIPKLDYVKFTRAKGHLYAYFRTGRYVQGREVRASLPPFGTAEFYSSYGSFKGARSKREHVAPTFASVSRLYQLSDDWNEKAANTKALYAASLAKVEEDMGDLMLHQITRGLIYEALDVIPGAATRNLYVAVIGNVFRFARRREMTTAEPTKDIPKFKTGEHAPWDAELLKAALAAEDDRVRLAVHLLYFTGQRIGDALKMRWSDIRGDKIPLVQEKTGKTLLIHVHRDLAAELAQTAKRGLTIVAQPNGKPYAIGTIREAIQAWAAPAKVVPHGLRKNAVIALLEAWATIPEVQAVTGQSVEMVMHYAAKVDQGRLSEAAILKLERAPRIA